MKLTHPYYVEKEGPCIILFHVCFLDDVAVVQTDTFVFTLGGVRGVLWGSPQWPGIRTDVLCRLCHFLFFLGL